MIKEFFGNCPDRLGHQALVLAADFFGFTTNHEYPLDVHYNCAAIRGEMPEIASRVFAEYEKTLAKEMPHDTTTTTS